MSVALNSKSTSVMSEKDDSKDAVVGSSPVTDTDPAAKAVVVSANRIMTDYELNEEKLMMSIKTDVCALKARSVRFLF